MKTILYRIWYNDWFRIFNMFGGCLIPLLVLGYSTELHKHVWFRDIVMLWYIGSITTMFIFNNYSNLRKVGYDEYGNKLKNTNKDN